MPYSSNKKKSVDARVLNGNEKAACIAAYLNHRCGYSLECTSLHEDQILKLDYRDPPTGKTWQLKNRESGKDIIFEALLFKRATRGKTKWRILPGRDEKCKANLYGVKPQQDDGEPEAIHIVRTKDVKELCAKAIQEWTRANGLDDDKIDELWELADKEYNKKVTLHVTSDGIEVQYKIDEGNNQQPPYSKIICYVPLSCVQQSGRFIKVLELAPDEHVFDSSSWRPKH